MIQPNEAAQILADVEAATCGTRDRDAAALAVVQRLSQLPHFSWTGIYWLNGANLELAAFVGEPTEHITIPVGRGVCGTAVTENANQIIADVSMLDNYLCCSLKTRSEIVVLIRDDSSTILGQVDIDGHALNSFDESDEALLEKVAALLARVCLR